jgi:hypothetical protein
MKITRMERSRDKSPLMKDLHELGLKHGVRMVVVAMAMRPGAYAGPLLIDHNDHTTFKDARDGFLGAGVYLIQIAGAVEDVMREEQGEDAS